MSRFPYDDPHARIKELEEMLRVKDAIFQDIVRAAGFYPAEQVWAACVVERLRQQGADKQRAGPAKGPARVGTEDVGTD